MKNVADSGSSLASRLKSGLSTAGKAFGVVTAGATTVGGTLLALESSTEEYRAAQGRLNTAFEAAGYSTEAAQQAYRDFYGILGDTDTATEASQLLAQLAENEEDLSNWTRIAAGVSGTFGDSLPIEGLIEAANETSKTASVTGVLADALNWVGISEDDFNAALEACSTEAERNQLIMGALSGQYEEAAAAFYENNAALVASRENEAALAETTGELGETISNIKNTVISDFLPSITSVGEAFNNVLNGAEGADEQLGTAIGGMVQGLMDRVPQFLSVGVSIIAAIVSGLVSALPGLAAALPDIVAQIGQAFMDLAPQLLSVGGELLVQIASGIETGLPALAQKIPEVIQSILGYFSENMPEILEVGVTIITSLANGILQAIPEMLAALPEIIVSFIGFIGENLPDILAAGAEILLSLVKGIIGAIPKLAQVPGRIISAIIEGIGGLLGRVVDIGKNIVDSIWEGIKSAATWLKDKVVGFFDGIVGGVLEFLGINSPSRVFREIGENMAAGLGLGWDRSFAGIRRDILGQMEFEGEISTARVPVSQDWAQSYGDRYYITIDAKNVREFNDVVEIMKNQRRLGRMYG